MDEFVFSSNDLYLENDGVVLRGYATSRNKEIISLKKENEYPQLAWVTYGNPRLAMGPGSKAEKEGDFFSLTPTGLNIYIQMCTEDDKELLIKCAINKYNIPELKKSQIQNLTLDKFICTLEMQGLSIHGEVTNFDNYPLKVIFKLTVKEKGILEEKIKDDNFKINEMNIKCKLIKLKSIRQNNQIFSLSAGLFNDSKLFDTVNGPANEVYVTRHQLSKFAGNSLNRMTVYEEIDMDQHQNFPDEFIKQIMNTLNQQFQKQLNNIDDLQKLSTYEFSQDFKTNFEGNLKTKIKEETRDENKSSNFSHDKNKNTTNTTASGSTNARATGLGMFSASGETRQNSNSYSSSMNANETENKYKNRNEIEIEIDQAITNPKNLDVLKISKIAGASSIEFSRIRVRRSEAIFEKKLDLITENSLSIYYQQKKQLKKLQDERVELEMKLKRQEEEKFYFCVKLNNKLNKLEKKLQLHLLAHLQKLKKQQQQREMILMMIKIPSFEYESRCYEKFPNFPNTKRNYNKIILDIVDVCGDSYFTNEEKIRLRAFLAENYEFPQKGPLAVIKAELKRLNDVIKDQIDVCASYENNLIGEHLSEIRKIKLEEQLETFLEKTYKFGDRSTEAYKIEQEIMRIHQEITNKISNMIELIVNN